MVNSIDSAGKQSIHSSQRPDFNFGDLKGIIGDNGDKTKKIDPFGPITYNRRKDRGAKETRVDQQIDQVYSMLQAAGIPLLTSGADIADSEQMSQLPPSGTYDSDIQTLNDMKPDFVAEIVNGVNRDVITPDTINHLGDLQPEQKAAMLYDLIQIKSEFDTYVHQYGDSAANVENARKSIDDRIDKLMADRPTQEFITSQLQGKYKEYLARPENERLFTNVQTTFFSDILGGKAIDRALASGKTFEQALSDFYQEFQTLSQLLPDDLVQDSIATANVTLSRKINDYMLSGSPGDLSRFLPDGNGNSPVIASVIDLLSTNFAAQNMSNLSVNLGSLKQDFSTDITSGFNGVIRLLRGGAKLTDALASYQATLGAAKIPPGIDAEMYKAGLFHAVQTLAMSATMVSKGIGNGQNWSATDISAALASGIQIAGMSVEGLAKNLSVKGKPFSIFGTANGTWGRQISNQFSPKNIEAGGKILGGVGGLAMAGLTFFSASRAFRDGNPASGALQIVGGVAGFASALGNFSEAALQLTGAVGKFLAPVGSATGLIAETEAILKNVLAFNSLAAGAILSAVGMVLGMLDMAKGVRKLDKLEKDLDKKLAKYTGEEVHFEFRPDPSFTW